MADSQADRLPSYLASSFYEEGMSGDDVLFFELSAVLKEAEAGLDTHGRWGVLDALHDVAAGREVLVPHRGAGVRLFGQLREILERFLGDGSCERFGARGVMLLLLDCEIDLTRRPLPLPDSAPST